MRIFSGIQPTGDKTLGNYIGGFRQYTQTQELGEAYFCIVDLHAVTIPENVDPAYLREKIRELAAVYLACGIDPEGSTVFVQSHVPAHAELTWLLNCVTPVGWLERMTQYKEKSRRLESVPTGLFDYPVLMAADILLYDTHLVPVGEDQKQHVELARDIAERFNRLYGETFVVPEPVIRGSAARVMGLDDPTVKMSKSLMREKKGHAIALLDPPDVVQRAISRAVTDPGADMSFATASPGVRNLLEMYEVLSGQDRETIEDRFAGQGYGVLKKELTELVNETLAPIQERYREIRADGTTLEDLFARGADRARTLADATLARVKDRMGIG